LWWWCVAWRAHLERADAGRAQLRRARAVEQNDHVEHPLHHQGVGALAAQRLALAPHLGRVHALLKLELEGGRGEDAPLDEAADRCRVGCVGGHALARDCLGGGPEPRRREAAEQVEHVVAQPDVGAEVERVAHAERSLVRRRVEASELGTELLRVEEPREGLVEPLGRALRLPAAVRQVGAAHAGRGRRRLGAQHEVDPGDGRPLLLVFRAGVEEEAATCRGRRRRARRRLRRRLGLGRGGLGRGRLDGSALRGARDRAAVDVARGESFALLHGQVRCAI